MDTESQADTIILGTGGQTPRVELFDGDSGETRKIIELDTGHSAYAIDIDSESGRIAVGTKGGLLYVVPNAHNEDPMKSTSRMKLVQGAPVLSVCWINKTLLAVSDTAGRCLLWHTNQDRDPQSLQVMEGDICCLSRLSDSTLAGLSSEGNLLFWQTMESQLITTVHVPKPPSKKALVRMVYWPVNKALAFPGPEGHLTIFYLENGTKKDLDGHMGDFYAVSLWRENLLTVGMEDGYLKIWQPETDKPKHEIKVPKGIISAGFTGTSKHNILLIDKQGKAGTYSLGDSNLQLIEVLPGKDYRTITTPDPERIQAFYLQKREDEARSIITEIQDKIDRAPDDVIDRLHSRLVELGYGHISLMLQAEQAEQKGDFIEALTFRLSMMKILPKKDPKTVISIEKYAALLEKLWHLTDADDVCQRIMEIDPNYKFDLENNKLARNANLVRNNNFVIEPDIPIEKIIISANIIEKQFMGRYLMKRLSIESCGRVRLSPKIIAEKYNMFIEHKQNEGLPKAITERVWWISRESVDEIDIVTFGDGQTSSIKGLQFALQVSSVVTDTLVAPLLVFDWRKVSETISIREENDKAFHALKRMERNKQSNLYISAVSGALRYAIRLLITENLSKQKKGVRR